MVIILQFAGFVKGEGFSTENFFGFEQKFSVENGHSFHFLPFSAEKWNGQMEWGGEPSARPLYVGLGNLYRLRGDGDFNNVVIIPVVYDVRIDAGIQR